MSTEPSPYSLLELAEAADVTPRTIRYYIAQGLLPPPVAAGPTTRYSAAHLDRLRLVRELQRQHLPLAEIRSRLEHLNDSEVGELAASFDRRPSASDAPVSAIEYIRALLAPETPQASVAPMRAAPPPAPPPTAAPGRTRTATPGAAQRGARESSPAYDGSLPAASQPGRSQWDRIVLAPDIELHVRRPLSRIQNRAVERVVGFARQLLEEEQK